MTMPIRDGLADEARAVVDKMRRARRRTADSRDKGIRGELEWRDYLREHFGCLGVRRGQQYCGGHDSPDVILGIPGTHAEVKRTERLSLYPSIAQAVRDAGEGTIPYVATRRNRSEWLIIIRAADLPEMARRFVVHEGATRE